jgi:hypothetical protein
MVFNYSFYLRFSLFLSRPLQDGHLLFCNTNYGIDHVIVSLIALNRATTAVIRH